MQNGQWNTEGLGGHTSCPQRIRQTFLVTFEESLWSGTTASDTVAQRLQVVL